jgi:hypothetical protein
MERVKGFEPSAQNSQPANSQIVVKLLQAGCTQIRAHEPGAASPDLAKVVAAWGLA